MKMGREGEKTCLASIKNGNSLKYLRYVLSPTSGIRTHASEEKEGMKQRSNVQNVDKIRHFNYFECL
jgi:hypothetical protein